MTAHKSQLYTKRADSGFTLVESMVSILLFGFLSMGIAQITMLAYRISYHNVYKTSAYSVMLGYVEQIKS